MIPTKNSEPTLGACLESLARSTVRPLELVVVDGGSRDRTSAIARQGGATFLAGERRRSEARRAGVAASRAPIVLFLDSDQTVAPDLVRRLVDLFADDRYDAVTIGEADRGSGPWVGARAFDRALATDPELAYPRAYRRAAYVRAGGHAQELEDFMEDRALRLRGRAVGLRIGEAGPGITNELGRIDPIAIGRRGAHAARDADAYYRTAPPGERLGSVVGPRLRNAVRPATYRSLRPRDLPWIGPYLLTVYGPRFLTVVGRRLRA